MNTTSNYYYKNTTDDLYYLCNNNLEGCTTCENENKCLICEENDYGLIEDNVCIKKSILKTSTLKMNQIENINYVIKALIILKSFLHLMNA